MEWFDVAEVQEIPEGDMKSVEVNGEKVLLANVEGKFYAVRDRCSHMNSPISMGFLKGKVLTCPLHFATFDITTGKKLSDPQLGMPPEMMEKLPKDFLQQMGKMGEIMAKIDTEVLKVYEAKTEQNRVLVKL